MDGFSRQTGDVLRSQRTGTFPEHPSRGRFQNDNAVDRAAKKKLASFSKATKQKVPSCEQALGVLAEGAGRRTVGATLMNCASSRSHAVFALELEISAQDGRRFTPKLLFVDLAGSE